MIIINYAVGRRSFCQWRSTETTKLCCCFPADDDQFSKLKAVFLATGRGCRQDLPLVEVDNRLLVQLLLPKDEGSKTLDETVFFQQLLKPDLVKTVLLSRLRYLWSTDWRSCLEASHFQEFHLFTAMAAASSDVNKWKRNLTQEMSTEPEDESEPDEPEFKTSFRFQQEGDIVAVYSVEDFFYQRSHQGHQWGRGNSQFLGEGCRKDGVVYRRPCSEDCTESSSAVVFAKNLQLAPSSLSPGKFVLCWISQEFIWQISSTQMLFTVKSPADRVNWLQITAL